MLVRESTLLLIKMDLFEKHGNSRNVKFIKFLVHTTFTVTPTYSTEYDIHDTCDKKIVRVCAFMNMTTIAQFLFICMIYLLFYLVSLSLSFLSTNRRFAVHVRICVGSGHQVSVWEKTRSNANCRSSGFVFFVLIYCRVSVCPPKKPVVSPSASVTPNQVLYPSPKIRHPNPSRKRLT